MRISIGPRPVVTVRPELRANRPPDEYVKILTKSESEFREYIRSVESDPGFEKLVSEGLVRKVHFKGRIPHHLYQEFQDREFVEFLKKYSITDKVDWETDFFNGDARRKVSELAVKYKAPRGELLKSLEYCRHLKLLWSGREEDMSNAFLSLDDPEKFQQPETSQIAEQSGESLADLAKLLEDHSISEEDFVEYFLSEGREAFEIARDLDMDVNSVEDILETLEKVHILSSMQVNVVQRPQSRADSAIQPIATISRLKNPPRAEIQIDSDEQYASRYDLIKPDGDIDKTESSLIEKLRMINQRRSLTFRVISFIYEFQYPYFVSGNPLYLKPLSQAQISREVGEHESTISRILRNKGVDTPEEILPLKFFCQSSGEVIERIINIREKSELAKGLRQKPFTDADIASILEKDYNTKVIRRTVTYHRDKIAGAPKFYKRRQNGRRETKRQS